jgi:hypothetical protein
MEQPDSSQSNAVSAEQLVQELEAPLRQNEHPRWAASGQMLRSMPVTQ